MGSSAVGVATRIERVSEAASPSGRRAAITRARAPRARSSRARATESASSTRTPSARKRAWIVGGARGIRLGQHDGGRGGIPEHQLGHLGGQGLQRNGGDTALLAQPDERSRRIIRLRSVRAHRLHQRRGAPLRAMAARLGWAAGVPSEAAPSTEASSPASRPSSARTRLAAGLGEALLAFEARRAGHGIRRRRGPLRLRPARSEPERHAPRQLRERRALHARSAERRQGRVQHPRMQPRRTSQRTASPASASASEGSTRTSMGARPPGAGPPRAGASESVSSRRGPPRYLRAPPPLRSRRWSCPPPPRPASRAGARPRRAAPDHPRPPAACAPASAAGARGLRRWSRRCRGGATGSGAGAGRGGSTSGSAVSSARARGHGPACRRTA